MNLTDIRVLELGTTRASAAAGRLLACDGAEVTRAYVPDAEPLSEAADLYFNAGKELVSQPCEALQGELASFDVLVCDLSDQRLGKLGLASALGQIIASGAIVVRTRPERDRKWPTDGSCGELTMQAGSGFMHMTGRPDRAPLGIPFHLGCSTLGIHAAGAASAALTRRQRCGEGALIEINGVDVLASYLRIYGAVSEYYEIPLKRDGRRAPGSGGRYPFGLFACADGYVALIGRTARDWENILEMMGNPPWASDPRYSDLHGIAMDYPDEVDALSAPWFREHTRAELLELAQQYGIPMAPVRRVDELTADPQFIQRGFFRTVSRQGRDFLVPGRPWRTEEGCQAGE